MAIPLLLTVFSVMMLQPLRAGGRSTLTGFTLIPRKLVFSEARNVCHSMNMTMLEVKDKTKQLAVEQFRTILNSKQHSNSLGIGLVRVTPGRENFTWVESHAPLTWSYWDNFSYADDPLRECVKMASEDSKWRLGNCDQGRAYMCELVSEKKCPYIVHPSLTLATDIPEVNKTSTIADLEECEKLCDTFVSAEGSECWAFHSQPLKHGCSIFYTTHPFLVNSVNMYKDSIHGTLYTKQCFYVSSPSVTGENLAQSTDMSSPISSNTYHDSISGDKVLPTSMTNSQKWRSTLSELMLSTNVKGESQPTTSVSSKMNVTDRPEKSSSVPTDVKTIGVSVSATLRSCYCPCYRKTQINNHKFINAVITNLTINKKNLSAECRKYYSVQDNRTLATGIGCTGVVILVLATSLVVCVDIFTLVEKLNGCRHR